MKVLRNIVLCMVVAVCAIAIVAQSRESAGQFGLFRTYSQNLGTFGSRERIPGMTYIYGARTPMLVMVTVDEMSLTTSVRATCSVGGTEIGASYPGPSTPNAMMTFLVQPGQTYRCDGDVSFPYWFEVF